MNQGNVRQRVVMLAVFIAALCACSAAPQVKRSQVLAEQTDTPYQKILVVTLYSKFDGRRYLEEEIVKQLKELGTEAISSTSMMNTKTPVTRETFQAMVDEIGADAVLVSQLLSLNTSGKVVDMSPEATVNLRPTGYYNVFSVDTTEYMEPQAVDYRHSWVLLTDMYSVSKRDMVWGIESTSSIKETFDRPRDFEGIKREAKIITDYLARDGLVRR